jgi:hypothetical protein
LNANRGVRSGGEGHIGGMLTYGSGDIDGRVSRGHTAWLESVGLGLIRKLVCGRWETTFFDVFREVASV